MRRCFFVSLFGLIFLPTALLAQQLTPEQQADMILSSARKAINEKNLPFAGQRFREFLAKFGNHKEAPSARFGLALALLDSPERNLQEVRDLLQNLVNLKDFPDQHLAAYYLGLAVRAQGIDELRIAEAKPAEAPQRRQIAGQRFEEAAKIFTAAVGLLEKRPVKVDEKSKDLPPALEWVARARCDQAEMFLRLQKAKEAQAAAAAFLKDPFLSKSRSRDQGRYYFGFASFLLKDYAAAQQALTALAPFTDASFGPHARYLLARTHHLADERQEAVLQYEAAVNDYAKAKVQAAEILKQPDKLKNDPAEKQRLEALLKNPPPDHVARSTFYLGVLLYEAGKFSDAKTRFAEFVKQFVQSPLKLDAEIRVGFCQVQLKEFAEAVKTLQPLIDRDPKLADQVLFWLGKAQAGAAPDPATNLQAYQQALNAAINSYRQAVGRVQGQDAEAKERRGDILLEIADTQQLLKQSRDAATTYQQILNDKLIPDRAEELSQRLITALHLANDFNESDKACERFLQQFPKSTLVPAVLFSFAENHYFRILAAEKNADPKARAKDLAVLYPETIKRFNAVIEKYPEYPKVNLARYSLGLTFYRQGELEAARKALEAIPEADRSGELAMVSYLMADCLIRLAPKSIEDDALAAGKLEEQLKTAANLLDGFVNAHAPSSETADAMIKLGLCQQRLAALMSKAEEKTKYLQGARATYERLLNTKQLTNHPLQTQAIFERAKVFAAQNEIGNAINELRRFSADPLRNSVIAPLAMVQLATYFRGQNNSKEAVATLAKAREFLEPKLGDPQKQPMIALLRFHHGVALREAGQLPEARTLFQQVLQQFPNRPEGTEGALRFGQCLKEEGEQKLELGRKLQEAAKKPEELTVVQKHFDDGYRQVREAATVLENQADNLKAQPTLQEVRARMYYEAAWCQRIVAELEIRTAKKVIQTEMMKKLGPKAEKLPPPEVALAKVPLQPAEKKARGIYQTLVAAFADLPLAIEARFELAELLADRGEVPAAEKLLSDAMDKEPNPDLTDKIRLRMGVIHASKGNIKSALAQFEAVAANPKSQQIGWAHYRAGEALLQNQQYPEAIKRLTLFRDQAPFQNVQGLSDRALLRLGHAYALVRGWDESRQAYERLVGAFPNSVWLDDARYGIGWALQQQKNYDAAVNSYSQVTQRTAAEIGAKAQLQIGLCRLEQKRYPEASTALLVVPFTYDYPELSAVALLEAGRAFTEAKEVAQARRLFDRVLRDYPNTPWADAAKERLDNLRK